MTVDELNYSICHFITEVQYADKAEYPPATLKSLVLMLQLNLQNCHHSYKILSDKQFVLIQNTLDNNMKMLSKAGVGSVKRQADIITIEEENILWNQKILGMDSPEQLLNTVFYVIGLNFALHWGEEHRSLCLGKASQISQHVLPDGKKERCPIHIYETYLSHLPQPLEELPGFYLRPLSAPTSNVWHSRQPLRRHKLGSMVKDICSKGNLGDYRTNHSLQATAATCLFDADIDEQLITEMTGHRSLVVRNYKRVSETKCQKINDVIQGTSSDKAEGVATVTTTPSSFERNDGKVSCTINLNLN